jgi:hypothetical protein
MRLWAVAAVGPLALVATASPAWGSDPKDEPLSLQGLSPKEAALFAEGVAAGVLFYDTKLALRQQPTLFCLPDDTSLDYRLAWSLAEKVLAGPHKPEIFAYAVVDELAGVFPCNPMSELERERVRLSEMQEAATQLLGAVEQQLEQKYRRCMAAVASAQLCTCLRDELPTDVDFATYVRVVAESPASPNAQAQLPGGREALNSIQRARATCTGAARAAGGSAPTEGP